MLNKINISPDKQKLIVYLILTAVTLAVFWQVNQYDFIITTITLMSQRTVLFNPESRWTDFVGRSAQGITTYGTLWYGFP